MAITYTWSVQEVNAFPEKDGKQNVVFNVHWIVNGLDGEHTASAYGSTSIDVNPSGPFTAYENLTEAQVIDWVKTSMGAEEVAAIEASIVGQINEQINPKIITPVLPWA